MKYNITLLFSFSVLFLLSSACQDKAYGPGGNCFEEAPAFGLVKIDATLNAENTQVPVEFFQGAHNDNRTTLSRDTITSSGQEFSVPIGMIGIALTYQQNGSERMVIDSVRMRYQHDESIYDGFGWSTCESCCYSAFSTRINMEL